MEKFRKIENKYKDYVNKIKIEPTKFFTENPQFCLEILASFVALKKQENPSIQDNEAQQASLYEIYKIRESSIFNDVDKIKYVFEKALEGDNISERVTSVIVSSSQRQMQGVVDEIGKAEYTSIRDKNHKEGFVLTEYYGDENGVVSNIDNSSNDEVTVNANEQEIILAPGGKVSFYENAQVKEYKNASDKSNTINVQDVSYEVEAHGSISFYENGKIADIKNDKMYKYYGENGQLRKLVNYQKDQTINERGYELKERKLYRVY